jgi:hypothetical protein
VEASQVNRAAREPVALGLYGKPLPITVARRCVDPKRVVLCGEHGERLR